MTFEKKTLYDFKDKTFFSFGKYIVWTHLMDFCVGINLESSCCRKCCQYQHKKPNTGNINTTPKNAENILKR